MLEKGMKAIDFKLRDSENKEHSLSMYLGSKVVIYFYPKNNTPGCNKQACTFRDNYDLYKERNIVLLGISGGDRLSHEKFRDKFNLPFPTLIDEDFSVSKSYEVYTQKSMFGKKYMGINRSTFIIDEKGFILSAIPKASPNDNALEVIKIIDNM